MEPETLARWGRWVRWHTPVLALPFRRRAVKRLAYWRLTLPTIPHLIAALESQDARVRQTATQALSSLSENPDCVDALCAAWAKGRNTMLGKLIAECRYQATLPVELRVLSGLQAGRLDELAREGVEAVPPLVAALDDQDAALRPCADQVLASLADPKTVDALCAVWAKGRNTMLGKLIAECRYQATLPVELRVLSGLQAGRLDELAREGAEVVPPLVAALDDQDAALRLRAEQVLASLANPKAVDALCDAWAKGRGATLGKLIAECRYQATAPVELRVLSGLQAGRLDELAREGVEAVPPLVAALDDQDAALRPCADQVLASLADPKTVDALCAVWAKGRNTMLGKLIAECRYQATLPVELRVLSGLQAGRLDELAREGAEAVPPLVAALDDQDAALRLRAQQVLASLANPKAVDALCGAWAKGRGATLGKLIAECRYQATAPVGLRVLSGLQAGRLEELAREGAEAVPPLVAALDDQDAALRPCTDQVLRSLADPKAVDALCAAWAKGRNTMLGKLIAECRYQATLPVELRVLSGLQAGRLDELAREGAEAVPPLVAALGEKDKTLTERAWRVLETVLSADELVDYAVNQAEGYPLLPFINAGGLRHSTESRWFLYLAVAGRFDDYLAADFEFQTLRAEFRAAPPELQARIREAIVRTGDTRMNPLFVAEKKQTLLAADLSDRDADLLVKVNARNQNWDALFKFLWVLPARHIREAVAAMAKARWQPEDADRQALFHKLAGLVATGGEAPKTVTAPLLLNPVLQQWLARGEKEWAQERALTQVWEAGGVERGEQHRDNELQCRVSQTKLRERLKDEVPPPDQIAALGALRAQGQLTPQVLDQAGHSQQWLVRLVAAALGASPHSTPDTQPSPPVNDGGKEWFMRLQTALDAESVWGLKPCHVPRDGLEALQEGLARLPDRRVAGGLTLLEAVVAHYTAHDIEIEVGARVVVSEDSFEIGG